jgi:hypothetical protein
MNRRSLTVLLGLLAAMLVLAGLLSITQRDTGADGGLLLPGLRDALNDIDRVVITGPGEEPIVTLARDADRWVVTQRNDYPADITRLRPLLIALAEARIIEETTANPALHARLGVQDLDQPEADGLRIALTRGDTALGTVLLGDSPAVGQVYARRNAAARSYLVAADLDPGRDMRDWLQQQVLDIPANRIATVTITHPDGEVLRLLRDPKDGFGFTVADLPEGRQLRFATVADGIGGVLGSLNLDDVTPAADTPLDDASATLARFETTSGLVIEARAWQVPDGLRVRFNAEAAGDPAAEDAAQLLREASDINARTAGWLYTLPTFKSEQLVQRLEDLLAPE